MQQIIVNVVCSAVALVGLAAAVWAVATGQLESQGIDALFLIAICLFAAVLFSWVPLQALRQARLGRFLKFKTGAVPAGEKPKGMSTATAKPQEKA